MLQIKKISKKYVTGDLVQNALEDISLNFRDNEFVSILGPSGSGKTTLLNIVGGLDRYDSGDLIINNISTKKYKDRDWDSYRNHTIGFVFQSYNLIPHQTVLSNVELALTISGISKKERKQRAIKALEKVGLGEQIHKKPNQMSGGQMQRVAIARALVNNPDILLADEPTGALDSETSIQVMELLKEVAKDKLVIMVTHNPELAQQYATRTVKLKDGHIIDDSLPYEVTETTTVAPVHKNMGKSSMGFLTSLALSFNNLRTKKGRTILTSFAGSIGIIGIALILGISNGVNNYINDIQRDTMTSYPITIQDKAVDMEKVMKMKGDKKDKDYNTEKLYSDNSAFETVNEATTSINKNNLEAFKKYLEQPDCKITKHLGDAGIVYTYNTAFGLYCENSKGEMTPTNYDPYSLENLGPSGQGAIGDYQNQMFSMFAGDTSIYQQLLPGKNGELVNKSITDNYNVITGDWPKSFDEVVIRTDSTNAIPSNILYAMGLIPVDEFNKMVDANDKGEKIDFKEYTYNYDDIMNKTFYMIPDAQMFTKEKNGNFKDNLNDSDALMEMSKSAQKIKISGIIKAKKDSDSANLTGNILYTTALTDKVIDASNESEVVKAQKANPDINVLNGMTFKPADDKTKVTEMKKYIDTLGISEKADMFKQMTSMSMSQMSEQEKKQMQAMTEQQMADMTDQFMSQADDNVLISMYDKNIAKGNYSDNMKKFGYVDKAVPASVSLYAKSFKDKEAITDSIKDYNKTAKDSDKLVYTDMVGMMISSMTTIINVITYVLIAFVSVSLIVSSIMIGIITYISVLERTKEIGVLRAIGASKHNVSSVFNAETFIIGLMSGVLGIGISCLIFIPTNALIHKLSGETNVNASIPILSAVILIVLSVLLTLLSGLIPSKKAARKDPVTALRSE